MNDGLSALSTRPFEYGLLRTAPSPWQEEDCLLVVWAICFDLQGNLQSRELARGHLREHSTKEQLAFLLPTVSHWDAPLDAPLDSATTTETPMAIPGVAPAWFGAHGPGPLTYLRDTLALRLGATTGRYQECAVSMVARWLLTTCTWESACHIFGIDYSSYTLATMVSLGESVACPCPEPQRWWWEVPARWRGDSPTAMAITWI